jgi:hypothetical protein
LDYNLRKNKRERSSILFSLLRSENQGRSSSYLKSIPGEYLFYLDEDLLDYLDLFEIYLELSRILR